MKLKFIKLDIEIMNDSKIKFIRKMPEGDSLVMMWIGLICIAMKSGIPGTLQIGNNIPFTDELLASELDLQLNTVRLGLKTFQNLKMIELFPDNTYYLTNFEKHQEIDKIERNNELNRQRVKKCREKKKMLLQPQNVMITEPLLNDNVTPPDKENKKEKDSYINNQTTETNEEYILMEYELAKYGWSGSMKKLDAEVGLPACLYFLNNILKNKVKFCSLPNKGGFIQSEFRKFAAKHFDNYKKIKENKLKIQDKKKESDNNKVLKKQYYQERELYIKSLIETTKDIDIQEFKTLHKDEIEFNIDSNGNPQKMPFKYFLLNKYPFVSFEEWLQDRNISSRNNSITNEEEGSYNGK